MRTWLAINSSLINYRMTEDMSLIPNPHSSGRWNAGFKFNNEEMYQLAVL